MLRLRTLFSVSIALSTLPLHAQSNWPQFRGPGGLGLGTGKPPIEFAPDGPRMKWKGDVPFGHSSPCIWGSKMFLTGVDQATNNLVTFCLDLSHEGSEQWRVVEPVKKLET